MKRLWTEDGKHVPPKRRYLYVNKSLLPQGQHRHLKRREIVETRKELPLNVNFRTKFTQVRISTT